MTREEAIDFGKLWLDMNEDAKGSKTYEFFELAVMEFRIQIQAEEAQKMWGAYLYDSVLNLKPPQPTKPIQNNCLDCKKESEE